jgi:hypothetical protein
MVSTKSASIPVTEPPLATLDRQRIPDWQLWLVGDGVEHAPLRALSEEVGIAEQVHFFGDVPYEQVSDWLIVADVGVVLFKPTRPLPSDPMKIYEYMACGLPVLTSDYPHYGGLVTPANAGVVADRILPPSPRRSAASTRSRRRARYAKNGAAHQRESIHGDDAQKSWSPCSKESRQWPRTTHEYPCQSHYRVPWAAAVPAADRRSFPRLAI